MCRTTEQRVMSVRICVFVLFCIDCALSVCSSYPVKLIMVERFWVKDTEVCRLGQQGGFVIVVARKP